MECASIEGLTMRIRSTIKLNVQSTQMNVVEVMFSLNTLTNFRHRLTVI